MVDCNDPALKAAVDDCRDNNTDTNWACFGYESKTKIGLIGKGNNGLDGLREHFTESDARFGFLRYMSGDQESKRVKFVYITWAGPSISGMVRARLTVHKPSIVGMIGQFHVEVFAEDLSECTPEVIKDKVVKSSGANYDLGSNAAGYETKGGDIKASAAAAYQQREKEQTIAAPIYETSALAATTPCDLAGRPMVAPPTEAMKNIDMSGNLDVAKFEGQAGGDAPPDVEIVATSKQLNTTGDDDVAPPPPMTADAAPMDPTACAGPPPEEEPAE